MIIFSSSLPSDLFTNNALVTSCTLGNYSIILSNLFLDTKTTGIVFINKTIAHHVCNMLKSFFLLLAKFKPLKRFDDNLVKPIAYAIYPILTIQSCFKLLAFRLVTLLSQHLIIFEKLGMQKHSVIFDMSCNKLIFWPTYC